MIIDHEKFIHEEMKYWDELRKVLDKQEKELDNRLSLKEVERLHYLYQRTAGAIPRLDNIPAADATRQQLEQLVAQAYAEIHVTRQHRNRFDPLKFLGETFPETFRKHIAVFRLTVFITLIGCVFGAFALAMDSAAKGILMPFSHLHGNPSDRVAEEEAQLDDQLTGRKTTFSAQLMTHNIRVSIFSLALGITWGIGTLILLFYNGVILGAVSFDYIMAGEIKFLAGWLLPHGAIEIPAILVASQAGLIIAGALIGRNSNLALGDRIRRVSNDVVTLIIGASLMLVWAGIIESFFSQYHEPFLPYTVKILFGVLELTCLYLYLNRSGKSKDTT